MQQLGYTFKSDNGKLKMEIEEAGICFLHAPLFHPALKTVGPIRKNLAMRTFFNMLGPIANPGRKAIEAALYPDEEYMNEGYLYFCLMDSEPGELIYAKTLEEHNANVAKYRPNW